MNDGPPEAPEPVQASGGAARERSGAPELRELADEVWALRADLDRVLPHMDVRSLRADYDQALPHLLGVIKQNQAHKELVARLDHAERRLEARRERPVAIALLEVLHRLRALDFALDVKRALDHDLVNVLHQIGFEEVGTLGEPFNPDRHEPLDSVAEQHATNVTAVYATGLASYGDVLLRARVQVGATDDAVSEQE